MEENFIGLDTNAKVNIDESNSNTSKHKIQQPKPQALPSRLGPSSILVSPRQKGNPVLNYIRSLPWEYSEIPADYVIGNTTCALFLSLKYHRLHPEYIYSRIRALAGKYNLRVLLTMVDIQNHEESLKELSKTSLINNVTIILCWSAQEAGRYLELYKTFEHAAPTSIRAHQSTGYSEKLVDFICTPRSINKTDAMGLVSNFGSIRTAINARSEEISLIAGWGHTKVQRWCTSVREPFRVQRTAKRKLNREESSYPTIGVEAADREQLDQRVAATSTGNENSLTSSLHDLDDQEIKPVRVLTSSVKCKGDVQEWQQSYHDEETMREASPVEVGRHLEPESSQIGTAIDEKAETFQPSEGIVAALAKLRQHG